VWEVLPRSSVGGMLKRNDTDVYGIQELEEVK
jgi:hypothetical protein